MAIRSLRKAKCDMDEVEGLKQAIMSYGATEDEATKAIVDVIDVINRRFLIDYLKSFNENDQTFFDSASEEEIAAFLDGRKDSLPPTSMEKYEKIADETWRDYFSFLDKNKQA
jgi:hypothetical protein